MLYLCEKNLRASRLSKNHQSISIWRMCIYSASQLDHHLELPALFLIKIACNSLVISSHRLFLGANFFHSPLVHHQLHSSWNFEIPLLLTRHLIYLTTVDFITLLHFCPNLHPITLISFATRILQKWFIASELKAYTFTKGGSLFN